MRLIIVGIAFLFTTSAAAQSRWTISAGPELTSWWNTQLWGVRFRAEYDVIAPSSIFGLRVEGGARWGPSQSYLCKCLAGQTVYGGEQRGDLMLGLSGSISPLARSRFSPYVTMGVFGRQLWHQGAFFVADSAGLLSNVPHFNSTKGDIIGSYGVGLRARIAARSFQLELRRIYDSRGLSFGSRLPF